MPTYTPKASEIQREWHVVDAEWLVLGRLCTEVARVLRGKHKPPFAPHIDTGDHVIIVNADKIVMTAGKAERTSFEVDTVSLHVHERNDPATILAAVRKRMQKSMGE